MLTLVNSKQTPQRILLLGIGNGGMHLLRTAIGPDLSTGLKGVSPVAVNTDKLTLKAPWCKSVDSLLLGQDLTKGLGAGADPARGRDCARADRQAITALAQRQNHSAAIVLVGLGGGTGSGAGPEVCRLLRASGMRVIAIATLPFTFEGRRRAKVANRALAQLRNNVDAVIVHHCDRATHFLGEHCTLLNAFRHVEQSIAHVARVLAVGVTDPDLNRFSIEEVCSTISVGEDLVCASSTESPAVNCIREMFSDLGHILQESVTMLEPKGLIVSMEPLPPKETGLLEEAGLRVIDASLSTALRRAGFLLFARAVAKVSFREGAV